MLKSLKASNLSRRMAATGQVVQGDVAVVGSGKMGPQFQPNNNTVVTLRVTRQTANIAQNLPVPVFAPANGADLYQAFLAPFLPSGVAITGMTNVQRQETVALGLAGNLQLTLTEGGNSDILTVACDNVPFLTLLQKMITDSFSIGGLRFTTPVANTSQLDQPVYVVDRTGYGSAQENNLVPSNYIDEYQQQPNIVTVSKDGIIKVGFPPMDSHRGLVVFMEQTAGLVYTITIGMDGRFLL